MEKKLYNRVIIVDDDYVSCFLSRNTIEGMNISTDVKFFTNPLDGITFIKEHCIKEDANVNECPNLIFLDINMPQMSGFEFMDKLKVFHKDYLFKDVIVMLSSSNNAKDISQAKEYGIRGYLEKPLTEDKVRSIDN